VLLRVFVSVNLVDEYDVREVSSTALLSAHPLLLTNCCNTAFSSGSDSSIHDLDWARSADVYFYCLPSYCFHCIPSPSATFL
jgi:hypothetical protein